MDSYNEQKAIRAALNQLLVAAEALERRLSALEQGTHDADTDAAELFSNPSAFSAPADAESTTAKTPASKTTPPPLPAAPIVSTPADTVSEEDASALLEEVTSARSKADTSSDSRTSTFSAVGSVRPPVRTTGDRIQEFLKRIGPKEEMSWEMALGTYWLPRIGILIMTIAVVLSLTLAVQKYGSGRWAPHLRVAFGYAVCVALLAFGKHLEHSATSFARVLLSGGLALSYFVTYSMHFVPYSHIITNRLVGLGLLAGVVIAWGTVAQLRRSVLVAFAVTILGHLTVLLSTFTLETPPRFGLLGVVLLSIVSAFFLLKNRWYYVAAAGMVGSYVNHAFWLWKSPGSNAFIDFAGSMAILGVYFLVFALSELYAPDALRRRLISPRRRTLYTGFNTACFFSLGLLVMRNFSFSRELTHLFYFAFGTVLLGVAWGYWARRKADPLYNAYFTKGTAVFTLGFAAYFDGATLTATLAVESVVLLVVAGRRGHVTSRLLAFGVALITVGHGLYTLAEMDFVRYTDVQYWPALISAVLASAALFGGSYLYQRTDWRPRTPRTLPFSKANRVLLWKFDLITEAPVENMKKPLGDLLIPSAYAFGAMLLILFYSANLSTLAHRGPSLMMIALMLTPVGLYLGSTPIRIASVPLTLFAALSWHRSLLHEGLFKYADASHTAFLVYGLTVLVPLLLLSELSRIASSTTSGRFAIPADEAGERNRSSLLSFGYALLATEAIFAATLFLAETGDRSMVVAIVALALTIYAWLCSARPMGLSAMFLVAVPILLFGLTDFMEAYTGTKALITVAALGCTSFFSEERYLGHQFGLRFHQKIRAPYFLYGVAVLLGGFALTQHFSNPLLATQSMVLAAGGVTLLALRLHHHAMGVYAGALLLWAGARWLDDDSKFDTLLWHSVAWSLAVFALASDRLHALRKHFLRDWVGAVLVVFACGILCVYAHTLAKPHWPQIFWMVIGLAFIGYGARFVSPAGICAGAVGAILATASHTLHSYDVAVPFAPLVSTYLALTAFWILAERGFARVSRKFSLALGDKEQSQLTHFLVAAPCILLIVMLERIPYLSDFYLTISWTVAALLMFGLALLIGQHRYRYAGLCTLALALARVMLIDTRNLEAIFRIAAFIFLGAVMLGVGYAYIQARAKIGKNTETDEGPAVEAEENEQG